MYISFVQPFRSTRVHPWFFEWLCCSIFSFLCKSVFVILSFYFCIVCSSIYGSDYPFGIFKLFFSSSWITEQPPKHKLYTILSNYHSFSTFSIKFCCFPTESSAAILEFGSMSTTKTILTEPCFDISMFFRLAPRDCIQKCHVVVTILDIQLAQKCLP